MLKRLLKRKHPKLLPVFIIATMMITGAQPSMNVSAATSQEITDMRSMKSKIVSFCIAKDIINDGTNARVQWCYKSQAENYLSSEQNDGSWSDVDYSATGSAANGGAWSPYLALDRMQAMAQAFADPNNTYYHSVSMKSGIQKAVDYWYIKKPSSVNWWENQIGQQQRLMKIAVMCEGYLTSTEVTNITNALSAPSTSDGTNSSWFTQEAAYKGLILEDATIEKSAINAFNTLSIVTVTTTGIQTDMGFFEHSKTNYTTGYGMSFARDMAFWAYLTTGTVFAFDKGSIDGISAYILDGSRWIVKGDVADLLMGMNGPNWPGYTSDAMRFYEDPLTWMQAANSTRASEFLQELNNIKDGSTSNGLNGNKTLWQTLVSSQMRDNYGVTVKMSSSTVKGGEWRSQNPNGYNLLYSTCEGATAIQQKGDEYRSIYPIMDWRHVSGTTAPYAYSKDNDFNNPKTFVGGVTNEKYGASAFDFSRMGVQGKKGYFFFEDEMVALGAGITSTAADPINTTLNQSLSRGSVLVDGNSYTGDTKSFTGQWAYNDGIGYVFPTQTTFNLQNTSKTGSWSDVVVGGSTTPIKQNIFSIWIDHGTKPTNTSYQYIVLPSKTSSEVSSYASKIPVRIISNTSSVQAVCNDTLKISEALFYQPSTITLRSGLNLTVDKPCMVIVDERGSTVKISAANPETPGITVNVTLDRNGTKTNTKFILDKDTFAGRSVTVQEGTTIDDSVGSDLAYGKPVVASSSKDNTVNAFNAVDSYRTSRWASNYTDNEWIYVDLQDECEINKVRLSWENAYAKNFKIQVSDDKQNWKDVYSTTTGNGGIEDISFNTVICRYVRMLGVARGTSYGYSLFEFRVYEAPNLALNKTVTASSTKSTDLTATNAVDGNLTTRWGSNYTDNEWISVDLGSVQSISNVKLFWETSYGKEYYINVSADGQQWSDIYYTNTGDGGTDMINFTATNARYIKMQGVKRGLSSYGYSLWEFKVFK